jgi:hypothetical protein
MDTATVISTATASITPTPLATVSGTQAATATPTLSLTEIAVVTLAANQTALPAVTPTLAISPNDFLTPTPTIQAPTFVRVYGKVVDATGGVSNAYVGAGLFGSQATGVAGDFSFSIPYGQEYYLTLSKTGLVMFPSAFSGTALQDQAITINAVSTIGDTTGCWIREMAEVKVAVTAAVLELYNASLQARPIKNQVYQVLNQIGLLPEVYLNCQPTSSCLKADLTTAMGSLRKKTNRLIQLGNGVVKKLQRGKAARIKLSIQRIRIAIKGIRRGTGKFPQATFLCR